MTYRDSSGAAHIFVYDGSFADLMQALQ
jgi:hypothetical protein